jgi:holliday junction DNA helicase RuvA
MIGRLTGRLAEKSTDHVILDVAGVGYLVHIPLSTFYDLPEEGQPAALLVHTHVREDAFTLYGFLSAREKDLFSLLIGVSGIGPRVALTVLSGIPPDELIDALARQDVRRLTAIPGVGKKTAERMVLELKDRVLRLSEPPSPARTQDIGAEAEDVASALVNLGYRKGDAERAADSVLRRGRPGDFGEFLKAALKELTGS